MAANLGALPAERCLAVLLDTGSVRLFRIEGDVVDEIALPASCIPAAPEVGAAGDDRRAGAGRPRRRRPPAAPASLPVLSAAACDHVHRCADRIAHIVRSEHVDRILAGGTPECAAELRRILRTRLGGDVETLAMPVTATALQVAEASRCCTRAAPTSREEQVLGELLDAVGRGLAAIGVGPVLDAVNEHRATVLIVARGARLGGGHCPACNAVFAAPAPARCPTCGAGVVRSTDVLQHLARQVRERDGLVEEINGPAGDVIRAQGGVAAMLRYAFPGAALAASWAEGPA